MSNIPDIPPPAYKIVVLGDSSVGKTSLIHRFTTDNFNPHTANTIGAAFITKIHNSNDKELKLEMWDTAGQERYRSLTPMYYRNAKTALICFDLSNVEETLETAKYWIDQLKLNGSADIRIKLVGTKLDVTSNDTEDTVRSFCQEYDIQLFKTSSKTGEGILELFNGVVDDIDEAFFTEYYSRDEIKSGVQFNRFEQSSGCC